MCLVPALRRSKTKKPEAEHPASGFFLKTSEIYLIASTIAFNVGLGRIALLGKNWDRNYLIVSFLGLPLGAPFNARIETTLP